MGSEPFLHDITASQGFILEHALIKGLESSKKVGFASKAITLKLLLREHKKKHLHSPEIQFRKY